MPSLLLLYTIAVIAAIVFPFDVGPYVQLCDPTWLLAAGLGLNAVSTFGNLFGGGSGLDYGEQKDLMRYQLDWQDQQNALARQFAMRQMSQAYNYDVMGQKNQYELNRKLWNEQFNKENFFNSPKHQAELLVDAGFAPQNLFGSNGDIASNHMSPADVSGMSISPVGAPMSASPVGLPTIKPFNMLDIFGTAADVYKKVAEAGKAGAETKRITTLLDDELKNLVLQNAGKEIGNKLLEIDEYIAENTKDTKISQSLQELFKITSEIGNIDADTWLKQYQALESDAKRLFHGKELEYLDEQLRQLKLMFNDKIKNLRADTHYKEANAQTLDALRPYETEIRKYISEQEKNNAKLSSDTIEEKCNAMLSQLRRDGKLSDVDYEDAKRRLEIIRKVNSERNSYDFAFRWFDDWMTYLSDKVGVAIGGSSIAKAAK